MTLSVRTKITLAILVAVAVGLAVAGWLTFRSFDQVTYTQIQEDMEARTRLAATSLLPILNGPSPPNQQSHLQAKAKELAQQAHARVTVIGKDGRVLADSATADDRIVQLENHGTRPEVIQAQQSGTGTDIRRSETTGERLLYVALPFLSDSHHSYIIRLALPLTTLDTHVADLQRILFIALAIAFFCAVLLSFLITKSLTQPLSDMAVVAQRLAAGELDQRIPIQGHDEIGTLGKTLNHMTEQLGKRIREVSEDRAQLQAMLTAMVEGVMVLDVRGIVLHTNPAFERMLVSPGHQVQGRAHWEVIRHPELNRIANQVLDTRQNLHGEIILAPSGQTFQVEASVAGGTGDNEACAVLVFHDVTALRRLEQVRKDFVANVSHELRTPLTSIQGYAQALKDDVTGSPEQSSAFLDIIIKQSDRLNFLLEDLLQLSEIESGKVSFVHEPVILRSLAERAVAMMTPQAEKLSHSLTLSFPEDLPPALGDDGRLLQVLTNLLDNAIKYSPPGGHITISGQQVTDSIGPQVEVIVSDTGVGIPPADRPRVFERFYRVDKARSQELGGTGLGLSIVKHIIEGHKGRVWVEGHEPRGSRFIIRLPAFDLRPRTDKPTE